MGAKLLCTLSLTQHAAEEEGGPQKGRLEEVDERFPCEVQGWCRRQEEEMVQRKGPRKAQQLCVLRPGHLRPHEKEAANFKLVTPSVLSERLKINGSLARRAIQELLNAGSIKCVDKHSNQLIYTRNVAGED